MIIRRRARMPRNVAKFKPVEPLQRQTDYPKASSPVLHPQKHDLRAPLNPFGYFVGFPSRVQGQWPLHSNDKQEREREREVVGRNLAAITNTTGIYSSAILLLFGCRKGRVFGSGSLSSSEIEWGRQRAGGRPTARSRIQPPSASPRSTASSRSDLLLHIAIIMAFLCSVHPGIRHWYILFDVFGLLRCRRILTLPSSRPRITWSARPRNATLEVSPSASDPCFWYTIFCLAQRIRILNCWDHQNRTRIFDSLPWILQNAQ